MQNLLWFNKICDCFQVLLNDHSIMMRNLTIHYINNIILCLCIRAQYKGKKRTQSLSRKKEVYGKNTGILQDNILAYNLFQGRPNLWAVLPQGKPCPLLNCHSDPACLPDPLFCSICFCSVTCQSSCVCHLHSTLTCTKKWKWFT